MTPRLSAPRTSPQTKPRRPRNAVVSKQALLNAAQSLFGQRGFEGTTIRDIGESAGVDPALIARYFGSKADLYIAAVVAEVQVDHPSSDFEGLEDMTAAMVGRIDEQGLGPVTQALIRSDTRNEIRQAAQAHMARRMVAPMVADMTRRGVDAPRLRSEIVVSALIGINLGRALGWFDELKTVPKERLVDLVTALLDAS
jgi:AcrR family transcriptional regulator